MICVLSTQTVSATLRDEAARQGIQLDAVPFIRTELLETGQLPAGPVIAVFTSQHAVESLPAIGPGWTIYCIEGATRRAVESRCGTCIIAGTASSGEELAMLIIGASVPTPVLFFCGNLRREELPAILRQAGFAVEERMVYRTLLTPHRVEKDYAGIAFLSPSAVESYFSANPVTPSSRFFAIGPTTAAAVRAKTGRDAIVASKPDKEVLIQEMITHFIV